MRLHQREWYFLAVLLGLIGCIIMTAQFRNSMTRVLWNQQKQSYMQALIEINVTGAVTSPGVYKFSPGISIKEILGQAGLAEQADKKKINFKRKVFASADLEVPKKEIVRSKKARIGQRNKKVCESQPSDSFTKSRKLPQEDILK